VHARTAATNAALLDLLIAETLPPAVPRVVAFFTNGSFDGIIPRYAAAAGG
jgi:UDP-N-acetylmuramate: L-alanyl-gamma-D-glutamyl-meso-diaminopimelate ligase